MPRFICLIGIALLTLFGVAQADVVSGGNVRVSFRGWISPQKLPRSGTAPIALHVAGEVTPIAGQRPEALNRVTIQINRHAVATTKGLPRCEWKKLLSLSSAKALKVCGDSLIGTGHFSSHIDIPEQAPFPSEARLLAFNIVKNGKPAVAAHIFGKNPAPTSEVLPMTFSRHGQGSFGPIVTVEMPKVGNDWGYVSGFDLTLKRRYRYRGREMSLISASCPAPTGLSEVPFKAARGIFDLASGNSLVRVLSGSCRVR